MTQVQPPVQADPGQRDRAASDLPRRQLLVAGAAVGLLAACGSSGSDGAPAASTPAASTPAGSTPAGSTPAAEPPAGPSAGALAATADAPVGGGTVNAEAKVVVTQPTAGQFKAFSATCTHQGCLVGAVADNEIVCACHGSRFSAVDGSVVNGPATTGLPEVPVKVVDGSVVPA